MKLRAFTLAETLITLGIIGVVAALTIPTLVQNYQEKNWETSANVFEKKLNEAIKVMNTQQILAKNISTDNFVKKLSENMKITKICDNNDLNMCFSEEFVQNIMNFDTMKIDASITIETKTLQDSKSFDLEDWGTQTKGLMFNNGITALVAYNKNCKEDPYNNRFNGTNCVAILYDTNGFAAPNELGKDIRQFGNINLGDFAFRLNGRNFTKAFNPEGVSYQECKEIVDSGEYGTFVGCWSYLSTDYWMGGVKQCGSIDNLPTIADLKKLAEILYPDMEILTTGYGQITSTCPNNESCINKDALKMIKEYLNISSDEFYIYSNTEDSTPRAVFRAFKPNETYQMNNISNATKGWDYIKTMCAY